MWNGPGGKTYGDTFTAAVDTMLDLKVTCRVFIQTVEVPPEIVAGLDKLYSADEYQLMDEYTDLSAPVYFAPRFRNVNDPTKELVCVDPDADDSKPKQDA